MKTLGAALLLLAMGIPVLRGESEAPFHFESDIAPYLARHGCAAAECHGGATGRGGFKLSLFATNARADYEAITQHLAGRRLDFSDPQQSLILRKPTKAMKHGGGRIIDRDSEGYRALESWIRVGAPYSRGDMGVLSRLEIAMKKSGRGKQAVVSGFFDQSEGSTHVRDVTALARFESTDDRVVSVDEDGLVSVRGPGEAWIIARYGKLSARFAMLNSFGPVANPFSAHPANPNEHWRKKLTDLGIEPAPAAGTYRILRRLYLDLVGRPPAPDEIAAFLKLPPPARVPNTARKLLASDEFSNQLARHLWRWFEVPLPEDDLEFTAERNARLREEIRAFAARDGSLLKFAASMYHQAGRREFVYRFGDPRDRAEYVGRAHFGISIGCARCHNHPFDRWSQAQHLQFSALFADGRPGAGEKGEMAAGMFFLPGDGKAIEPALLPLWGPVGKVDSHRDHGEQLANYLQDDGITPFVRNAANRMIGILLGTHLVDAPDDHRLSNPALHEPYLFHLAKEFEQGDYRLRHLVEWIVTSPLYALDSDPPGPESLSGDPQLRYLARREARPMSSNQFLRSATFVLGIDPPREKSPATPLAQQLHLLNSGKLQEWLRTPGNQVDAIFDFEPGAIKRLDQLYLLILTRHPRPEEQQALLPLLVGSDEQHAVVRDLAFALLASREFSSIR